jgi:hypothetical protein
MKSKVVIHSAVGLVACALWGSVRLCLWAASRYFLVPWVSASSSPVGDRRPPAYYSTTSSCYALPLTDFLLLHDGHERASTSIPRERARPRPQKRKVGDSIRGEPPLIRHMGVRGGLGDTATPSTPAFLITWLKPQWRSSYPLAPRPTGEHNPPLQCRHPGACIVLHRLVAAL